MSFWCKDDPVIVAGQVIHGGMFAHQRAWWESTAYIKALVAGYGAGKTGISAKRAIAISLQNNGSPHLYVSPSYKIAKRTIIPHLKAMLDGRGIKHRHNKTDHEFKISHKGRTGIIWIGSGDDADSLKGPNIGSANIDEPFIQKREVFKQVMARVRDPKALIREITLTGTPEELNWGYEICEGSESGDFDIEVIHASTRDNLALPEQYIDSLLSGYDEQTVQAYVDGKFVLRAQNGVYYNYTDDNHADREFKQGVIHWAHDFNFMPMSSAIIQIEDKTAYVVDEIILEHAVALTAAREFVERYKEHKNCPVILYGDASGRVGEKHGHISDYIEIEQHLRDNGFTVERKVPLANPSIKDGQNSLRAKILNAKDEITFFVNNKKCPTVDRGLKTVRYKEGSTFQEDETNMAQHVTTALRYFTNIVFPTTGRGTLKVT